jgi:hypothetical protein
VRYWVSRAACRSDLPRERFSPLTHLGSGVCTAAVETMLIFAKGLGAIPGYRD